MPGSLRSVRMRSTSCKPASLGLRPQRFTGRFHVETGGGEMEADDSAVLLFVLDDEDVWTRHRFYCALKGMRGCPKRHSRSGGRVIWFGSVMLPEPRMDGLHPTRSVLP